MRNDLKVLLGLAVVMAAAPAFAETISTIETADPTGAKTAGITLGDTTPLVIDAIGSSPQTLDGYTYTSYALLVSDGTGYTEIFGKLPSGSTYTPTVGDAITASGTFYPYQGIPELETLSAISKVSSGNAVPAPIVTDILTLDVNSAFAASTAAPGYSPTSGAVVELDDLTIGGGPATFATHANTTFTDVEDDEGDIIELYQYASSYSAAGAFGGETVPTGPVDITGVYSIYMGSPEIIPFSITPYSAGGSAVPEPASLGLLGAGALGLLARRRKA
jgi:hypothetical protein